MASSNKFLSASSSELKSESNLNIGTGNLLARRTLSKSDFTDANPINTRPLDYSQTVAYRPMTSNAFRVPYNLSDPIGTTHYDDTFYAKYVPNEEPIRTATASGSRNNKPHPTKEFMVFRFRPLKLVTNPGCDWSQPIGDKLIAQVIKNQMKSTYATDYVNNVEEKLKFQEIAKQTPRLSSYARMTQLRKQRESEMDKQFQQFSYNVPFKYESLNISPTRYACNIRHNKQANGIVPGCSQFWQNSNN